MSALVGGTGDCEPVFARCWEACRPGWCPCLGVGDGESGDEEDGVEEETVPEYVDVIKDLSLYESPEPEGEGSL